MRPNCAGVKSRRRGLPISAFAGFELSKVSRKSFSEQFPELEVSVKQFFIARGDPMPQPLHGAAYRRSRRSRGCGVVVDSSEQVEVEVKPEPADD